METEHLFAREEVFPSWFTNALGSYLSVQAAGFTITKQDATHIQVVAGANDQAAVVGIAGRWRWIEATASRAHPGGAAGSYDIFVTAAETDIEPAPAPYTDDTNYSFALAIVAAGATPAIVAGVVDIFRRVGSLTWDGAQITQIRQIVPTLRLHAYSHATGGVDPLLPSDIGAATEADLLAEVTRAENAEATEIGLRMAADASEAANRSSADTTETAARTAADSAEATARTAADTAESSARTAAVAAEATTRAANDTTETAARTTAVAAEATARQAGDIFQVVHVACWDDQTSPPQPAGSVIAEVPAPVVGGQVLTLIGVYMKCSSVGVAPTQFKIQTDHGSGGGVLADEASLTNLQPAAGRFAQVDRRVGGVATPLPLARGDSTAVVLTVPGNSLGCKVALLFGRSA